MDSKEVISLIREYENSVDMPDSERVTRLAKEHGKHISRVHDKEGR